MNSEKETQLLELKPGGQMEVIKSGGCFDVDAKDKLQLNNGKVGKRCVEVLRDTGCTGVLIKRDLVNQGELTGEKGYVATFDKTLLIRSPIAKIEVDTPFFRFQLRWTHDIAKILCGRSRSIVCPGTSC